MAQGTSLVYAGTDAPLVVDCHTAPIEGIVLDLYDVYTAGNYNLKVVGDGTALGTTASVARAKISAHRFAGFKTAGFFTKWCMFVENKLDILNMYSDVTAPNAWGYYFDPTDLGPTKAYYQEANKIHTITVNSRRALYGGGQYFDINEINIGTDYGSLGFDATQENMVIGGPDNIITIPFVVVPSAQQFRTAKIHFLPNAARNILNCPPIYMSGIVDEAPNGSNVFQGPKGRVNYLKNGSFESWNSASTAPDWNQHNARIAAITGENVRHGLKGIAITSTGAYSHIYQTLPTDLVGKDITLCGWYKAPSSNTATNAVYLLCSAGGASFAIPNDGFWHFLAVPYTVPAGATDLKAYIFVNNPSSGTDIQTVYADGLVVVTGTTPVLPDEDPGKVIYGTAGWNPNSVNDGAMTSTKVGCIGAAVGDSVSVGFSMAVPAGAILSGSVTAADTVTVTLFNKTGAPLNLGLGILKVVVRKNEN